MSTVRLPRALNLSRFFYGDGPQASPVHLHRRRVYILPTRQGIAFALLLLLMLLGSMNYNNSLGFLTTFLLAGMYMLTMMYTNRNVLNLSVSLGPIKPVFAGEMAFIPVHFHNQGYATRYSLQVHYPGKPGVTLDIDNNSTSSSMLESATSVRGEFPVGRLVVDSVFPLGLFRCWSYVETHDPCLVYPAPSDDRHLPDSDFQGEGEFSPPGHDPQDFSGLRRYTPGDPFHRIHWPSYAKSGALNIKQFTSTRSHEIWLDWNMCHTHDIEQRLSQLCRWILLAQQQNLAYGLNIPGVRLLPARGEQHFHDCLASLARFNGSP